MLRVEGLRRRAGDFQLDIEDWAVGQGVYLVLVGRSGAGKTMLLETIAGLHSADGGRVWIGGQDVTNVASERRGIGFVYQDCWLFPHLTVRENINFGRRYHRRNEAGLTTESLAEVLHIGDLLDRKPLTLSGGERQRVALARALAIKPRLLFLDEPLGTLDPSTREQVAAEIGNCHRRFGMTTIHVTHDHAEARMMGDHVAVMLDGRIAQSAETEDVFRRPRSVVLARFLGCENLMEDVEVASDENGRAMVMFRNGVYHTDLAMQGPAVMCVRAEDVSIGMANSVMTEVSDGFIKCEGRIVEMSDRGAMVRVVVDSDSGRWVSLISRSQQRESVYTVGCEVIVRVPMDAIHLLPRG